MASGLECRDEEGNFQRGYNGIYNYISSRRSDRYAMFYDRWKVTMGSFISGLFDQKRNKTFAVVRM